MKRLLQRLEAIFWPRGFACLCCGLLSEGQLLCPDCLKALLAVKLPASQRGDDQIRSVFRYEGNARLLVHKLKWECLSDAADALAVHMAAEIQEMSLPDNIVLTWVTMPDSRRKKRGIDHGRELCQAVARRTGLPARQLLVRLGNGTTQRGLSKQARRENMLNRLRCDIRIDAPVLIIDDVLTTGATVQACAQALLEAGAASVYALTATKVVLKTVTFID